MYRIVLLTIYMLVILFGMSPENQRAVISSLPFTINAPGTYTLSNDLTCEGPQGTICVRVAASNVVIDLQGHSITCTSTDPARHIYGIKASEQKFVTIRNGSVNRCFYGIELEDVPEYGLYRPSNGWHLIENMYLEGNTFRALRCDGAAITVRNNTIENTGGTTFYPNAYAMGIECVGPGSYIHDNYVHNTYPVGAGEGVGIAINSAGKGSTIANNEVVNDEINSQSTIAYWAGGSDGETVGLFFYANHAENYAIGFANSSPTSGFYSGFTFHNVSTEYISSGDWKTP